MKTAIDLLNAFLKHIDFYYDGMQSKDTSYGMILSQPIIACEATNIERALKKQLASHGIQYEGPIFRAHHFDMENVRLQWRQEFLDKLPSFDEQVRKHCVDETLASKIPSAIVPILRSEVSKYADYLMRLVEKRILSLDSLYENLLALSPTLNKGNFFQAFDEYRIDRHDGQKYWQVKAFIISALLGERLSAKLDALLKIAMQDPLRLEAIEGALIGIPNHKQIALDLYLAIIQLDKKTTKKNKLERLHEIMETHLERVLIAAEDIISYGETEEYIEHTEKLNGFIKNTFLASAIIEMGLSGVNIVRRAVKEEWSAYNLGRNVLDNANGLVLGGMTLAKGLAYESPVPFFVIAHGFILINNIRKYHNQHALLDTQLKGAKSQLIQYGTLLQNEFNAIKKAFLAESEEIIMALQQRALFYYGLKDPKSLTMAFKIEDCIEQLLIAREMQLGLLQKQYQQEIHDLKQATSHKASSLQALESQRRIKRVNDFFELSISLAGHFYPPAYLGFILTGGVDIAMKTLGNHWILETAKHNHGVLTDGFIELNTTKEMSLALDKARRIDEVVAVITPPIPSIGFTTIRMHSKVQDAILSTEKLTRFQLQWDSEFSMLDTNSGKKALLRACKDWKNNFEWVAHFHEMYLNHYSDVNSRPQWVNFELMRQSLVDRLEEIKRRIDNYALTDYPENTRSLYRAYYKLKNMLSCDWMEQQAPDDYTRFFNYHDIPASMITNLGLEIGEELKLCIKLLKHLNPNQKISNAGAIKDEFLNRINTYALLQGIPSLTNDLELSADEFRLKIEEYARLNDLQAQTEQLCSLHSQFQQLQSLLLIFNKQEQKLNVFGLSDVSHEMKRIDQRYHVELAIGVKEVVDGLHIIPNLNAFGLLKRFQMQDFVQSAMDKVAEYPALIEEKQIILDLKHQLANQVRMMKKQCQLIKRLEKQYATERSSMEQEARILDKYDRILYDPECHPLQDIEKKLHEDENKLNRMQESKEEIETALQSAQKNPENKPASVKKLIITDYAHFTKQHWQDNITAKNFLDRIEGRKVRLQFLNAFIERLVKEEPHAIIINLDDILKGIAAELKLMKNYHFQLTQVKSRSGNWYTQTKSSVDNSVSHWLRGDNAMANFLHISTIEREIQKVEAQFDTLKRCRDIHFKPEPQAIANKIATERQRRNSRLEKKINVLKGRKTTLERKIYQQHEKIEALEREKERLFIEDERLHQVISEYDLALPIFHDWQPMAKQDTRDQEIHQAFQCMKKYQAQLERVKSQLAAKSVDLIRRGGSDQRRAKDFPQAKARNSVVMPAMKKHISSQPLAEPVFASRKAMHTLIGRHGLILPTQTYFSKEQAEQPNQEPANAKLPLL